MKSVHLLSVVLLSLTSFLFAQDSTASIQPNIILVVVDDLGWNDVSYHGSEVQTPNIDRMARQGVELNRFYVHPACSPTRSALMTGKAAVRLGFVNPIGKNNVKGLALSEKIMPQYFKENGYQTYLIGKWHLGRFKKEYWPYNRGFDYFYGYLTGGVGHYDHIHGGGLDWQRNGETLREEGYSTHLLTKEAIKVIKDKPSNQPFFLELCYAAPHMPNEAPEATIAEYQHLDDNKNRQIHAAMVTEVDRGIQQIYTALEEKGILDQTIIWFMSDNGGQNRHGASPAITKPILRMEKIWGTPLPFPFLEFIRDNIVNGASDNSPLKGGKNTAFEGGVRVPAFIYAPGWLKRQKVEERITVNDILPTLAAAVNFTAFDPTPLDGVSQWHFLSGIAPAPEQPFVAVSRFNEAYYKGEWKLILTEEKELELYKILADPTEQKDLADQYPEVVNELEKELLAFPRGEPVDDPLWKVFVDPDLFGGTEDREPFAGKEGLVKGPLHRIFYIFPIVILTTLSLLIWLISKSIRRIQKWRT